MQRKVSESNNWSSVPLMGLYFLRLVHITVSNFYTWGIKQNIAGKHTKALKEKGISGTVMVIGFLLSIFKKIPLCDISIPTNILQQANYFCLLIVYVLSRLTPLLTKQKSMKLKTGIVWFLLKFQHDARWVLLINTSESEILVIFARGEFIALVIILGFPIKKE